MAVTELIAQIIQILTGAIVPFGTKVAEGISAVVNSLIYTTTGTGADAVTSLSTFAVLVLIFASVALASGLGRWVLNFFSSLGGRNR